MSKLPRNTVTLWLDGSEDEVIQNFKKCQAHLRYWIFCNAYCRVRKGARLVYTTPITGTFYYVIRYQRRHLVFVIAARSFWMVGFYGANGVFQMQLEDQVVPYMDSPSCHLLNFFAGYGDIAEKRKPGNTRLGLGAFRRAFTTVCDHKWTNKNEEDPQFRISIGLIVCLLMESKFREVLRRCCRGMNNSSISRLGLDWVSLLIVNWSALSKEVMHYLVFKEYVMREHALKKDITTFDEIFNNLFFLHLDALSEGVFTHPELPPTPRWDTWCPIDPGQGDGDIAEPGSAVRDDARERYIKMENRAEKGRAKKAGQKRGSSGWAGENAPIRRKLHGPGGGGAGGPPDVPDWFSKWEHLDKEDQSKLVVSEAQKLGLMFLDVPEPTRKFKTDNDDIKKDAESKLVPSEAQKLELEFLDIPEPIRKFKADDDKKKEQDIDNSSGGVCRESNHERIPAPAASNDVHGLNIHDVEDLRGNRFVGDSVISYYFTQLPSTNQILLQPPSIGQVLTNSGEDHVLILEPLLQMDHRLVLFALSDNTDIDGPDGGLHYSLLVYDNTDQSRGPRFVHHDSSASQMNTQTALKLVERLRPLLPGANTAPFINGPTPTQDDYGNDCAIYVMSIARTIYQWWSTRDGVEGDWIEAVNRNVNANSVRELRATMADTIQAIISGQKNRDTEDLDL